MAKLARERRLMERRIDKQARKEARKQAAAHGSAEETDRAYWPTDETSEPAEEHAVAKVDDA